MKRLVQDAWGSHVANFATSRAIYSLFPESVSSKAIVEFYSDYEYREALLQQYLDAGFHILTAESVDSRVEFVSDRFIGDQFTDCVLYTGLSDFGSEEFSWYRFRVGARRFLNVWLDNAFLMNNW